MNDSEKLRKAIRDVPDFPTNGIIFKDITPVLSNSQLCQYVIEELSVKLKNQKIDAIAGIESRGFLFGMSLAQKLGVGFIPVRKKGKLPYETVSMPYQLEYGMSEVEIHKDSISPKMRVHIHDDLLATGGTAEAVAKLVTIQGAQVASFSFIIELEDLHGRKVIEPFSHFIDALVVY